MKKTLLLACLICFCIFSNAQKSLVFKETYIPNQLYIITDSTNTDLEFTFKGDSDAVAKIKAQGLTSPTKVASKSVRRVFLTSDSIKADGSIPITLNYYTRSKSNVNGIATPATEDPLNNKDIKTVYTPDDKITVISINGDTPYDKIEAMENLMNAMRIRFPDSLLKVGDTFSRSVPFDYPAQGMNEKVVLVNKYKLTAIQGDSAFFVVEKQLNTGIDIKNTANAVSMNGTGSGLGKMIFNIKKQCIINNIEALNYVINVNKTGLKMTIKYKTTSKQITEIIPKPSKSESPPTVKELKPVH